MIVLNPENALDNLLRNEILSSHHALVCLELVERLHFSHSPERCSASVVKCLVILGFHPSLRFSNALSGFTPVFVSFVFLEKIE